MPFASPPRAAARLQFSADFTFRDAARLVPYLARLGVSHLYASPLLKARPGSTHGYDIIDHGALNPEIGGEADFLLLSDALNAHGMGLILDFVPNHMGVGEDNEWWMDVLEWGEASPYAGHFDIEWRAAGLQGRVLLPVLGDHYGRVLERGELHLAIEQGGLFVRYFDRRFPVALRHYETVLRHAAGFLEEGDAGPMRQLATDFRTLATLPPDGATPSDLRDEAASLKNELGLARDLPGVGEALDRALAEISRDHRGLHALLEQQHWRIAYWRVAADDINYRRFFDVNDLAGLRVERPELFAAAHCLVFRLIEQGRLQGLRIDHVDGLFDPLAYCQALQRRASEAVGGGTFYIVVEKILAGHEHLDARWPVAGTTGYEFMVLAAGLFVDPAGEAPLSEAYERFLGRTVDARAMREDAKRLIIGRVMSAELNMLAQRLHAIAQQSWLSRDYTLTGVRRALTDIVVQFPVYRTYIDEAGRREEDRRTIGWAVAEARGAAEGAVELGIYDFLQRALTTDLASEPGYDPQEVRRVAMRIQQFTGPVMAKSVEDTLFYRHARLLTLNEVGGDPERWGTSPDAFHDANADRLANRPHQLLATATHDHKRGADARLRIAALSECPAAWDAAVQRWTRLNADHRRDFDGRAAPGRNDEYFFYQALLGAWPLDGRAGVGDLAERMVAYMRKAVRESKYRSSWALPDVLYEEALERFIRRSLDPTSAAAFLADFAGFAAALAPAAALHGLAQALLATTAPGVPDLYQGTEFWDFSLVDPDNRRPVDWNARQQSLDAPRDSDALVAGWRSGRIKQHVIARALELRACLPALFAEGSYRAVAVEGAAAGRVVAFVRQLGDVAALVVAPRLVLGLIGDAERPLIPSAAWGDTRLVLPAGPGATWCEQMTQRVITAAEGRVSLAGLLSSFPVALLTPARLLAN